MVELFEDDRAQQYTWSALLAGMVLLSAIGVGMEMQPTDTQSSAENIEQELALQALDVLTKSKATGELKETATYWDDSAGEWEDTPNSGEPYTRLGPIAGHPLQGAAQLLEDENIAYNIELVYQQGPSGDNRQTIDVVFQGVPGAHAVVQEQTIILRDDDRLQDGTELQNTATYPLPDAFPSSQRFNLVEVRLILWRL